MIRRRLAQGDDDAGPDELDLADEIGRAGLHLVAVGHAVVRRPALDHVRDVDLVLAEGHGGDDLAQELAGPADEGPALQRLRPGPGPSPMNISSADRLPSPGTALVRSLWRTAEPADADLVVDLREGVPLGGRLGRRGRRGTAARRRQPAAAWASVAGEAAVSFWTPAGVRTRPRPRPGSRRGP